MSDTTPTPSPPVLAYARPHPGTDNPALSLSGALTAARKNCGGGCFAYHATWRLTRLLGLKGNPAWHEGFYRQALTDTGLLPPRSGRVVRVLVCASADETMLAVLARILTPTARQDTPPR